MEPKLTETQYGFDCGSASIMRIHSDETGRVVLGLTTPKHSNCWQISVTRTGKVRFFDPEGRELKPQEQG